MNNKVGIKFRIFATMSLVLLTAHVACAAIVYVEDFEPDANGWGDRDAGEMGVSHDAGNDWMVGAFGTSFLPMTDAFRISSGANFVGDYTTYGNGLTQISFELQSVNFVPSDLFIRIIDGANTFSYQFNPLGVGSFDTYTVNLDWSFGWVGLSEAAFNTALTSVDALEIQITRNGSSAQSYYLDNVTTYDTDIGDPGGPMSIPEPKTFSLFVLAALAFAGFYRRSNRMIYSR